VLKIHERGAILDLTQFIRDIPDFPKEGIIFKDITPLLANPNAMSFAISQLHDYYKDSGVTSIAGIESRGFIFGTPLAAEFGVGFIPIRKPGKLPYETISEEYSLEYGTDAVEMHIDAVKQGDKILIIDDLLATGGTAAATKNLIERSGGEVVGIGFIIELGFLNGIEKLGGVEVHSLIKY
jgi:adenine phosphoribosyltransferase